MHLLNVRINILIVGECGLPVEYCENGNPEEDYEKCKKWLQENIPDEFERLTLSTNGKSGFSTY